MGPLRSRNTNDMKLRYLILDRKTVIKVEQGRMRRIVILGNAGSASPADRWVALEADRDLVGVAGLTLSWPATPR